MLRKHYKRCWRSETSFALWFNQDDTHEFFWEVLDCSMAFRKKPLKIWCSPDKKNNFCLGISDIIEECCRFALGWLVLSLGDQCCPWMTCFALGWPVLRNLPRGKDFNNLRFLKIPRWIPQMTSIFFSRALSVVINNSFWKLKLRKGAEKSKYSKRTTILLLITRVASAHPDMLIKHSRNSF